MPSVAVGGLGGQSGQVGGEGVLSGDLSCCGVVLKESVLLRESLKEDPAVGALCNQPEVSSWVLAVYVVVVGSEGVHSEDRDVGGGSRGGVVVAPCEIFVIDRLFEGVSGFLEANKWGDGRGDDPSGLRVAAVLDFVEGYSS